MFCHTTTFSEAVSRLRKGDVNLDTQILAVEHLNKCFGQAEILHDVDFSVSRGDVYGLVGQNGAGKTTLLRLIAGLMKPTKGNILCYMEKDYIGYLPQSCRFDDGQTVTSTISFFSTLRKVDKDEGILLCKKLGLDMNKKVKHLSPGQQKKLQMVIAMIGDPDFYILDEPTAGLDPSATFEMSKLIRELHEKGKSILLSSHILQDMDAICTNVAIMESGSLIYDRELESSYIVSTSPLPEEVMVALEGRYSLGINADHTTLHVKTDKKGVARLVKILVLQSVDIYEVTRSSVKNVVQEQLHMVGEV